MTECGKPTKNGKPCDRPIKHSNKLCPCCGLNKAHNDKTQRICILCKTARQRQQKFGITVSMVAQMKTEQKGIGLGAYDGGAANPVTPNIITIENPDGSNASIGDFGDFLAVLNS